MNVAAVSEVCVSAALTGGSPDTARVPGLIVKGDCCPLLNQGEGTGAMGRAEKSVPRSVSSLLDSVHATRAWGVQPMQGSAVLCRCSL